MMLSVSGKCNLSKTKARKKQQELLLWEREDTPFSLQMWEGLTHRTKIFQRNMKGYNVSEKINKNRKRKKRFLCLNVYFWIYL